jgi:hypothetical protein
MRKITCKNKRFPVCAYAIFAIAICLCMLFTACKDEPDDTPPPPENKPPVANVGSNQNVTLASNLTVTLNGTASTDPDGSIDSYAWECTGYTKHADVATAYTTAQITGMLNNADKATATVDLRKAGTYTFKLTVTDNDGATNAKEVTVVVNPQTVTKNVSVSFPAFTPGSTTLNLTPTYTPTGGWGDDFVASDITYTLSDNKGNSDLGNSVSAISGSYNSGDRVTFTQTFIQGNVIVSNSFIGIVMNMSGLKFVALLDTADNDLDTAVPTVTLNLSKTITEVYA